MSDTEFEGAEAYLARVRERYEKSTPGVWKVWAVSVMADQDGSGDVQTAVDVATAPMLMDVNGEKRLRTFDADFIAAAHQDVPRLVGAVEALLAKAEEMESLALNHTTEPVLSNQLMYTAGVIRGVLDRELG